MYELLIKLIYEADYKRFILQELSEMKAILNQYNKQVLEVKLKRLKENVNEGQTIDDNKPLRSGPPTKETRGRSI